MHSLILLASSIGALLVTVKGWGRIAKRDILFPAALIGVVGGTSNAAATFHVHRPAGSAGTS